MVATPLATAADLVLRYPIVTQDIDPLILADTMLQATDHIEGLTQRRLAPFTGVLYQDRLLGIDPMEYGATADMPLPFSGSLGLSYANAVGASDLVRHFWLDEFAPRNSELWTYNVQSIILELTYGNTIAVNVSGVRGPATTDGHIWLPLGTLAPIGTRVNVLYGGGYTVGIPPSLRLACLYQAVKFLIVDTEPQSRQGLHTDALEAQIVSLLAPWART